MNHLLYCSIVNNTSFKYFSAINLESALQFSCPNSFIRPNTFTFNSSLVNAFLGIIILQQNIYKSHRCNFLPGKFNPQKWKLITDFKNSPATLLYVLHQELHNEIHHSLFELVSLVNLLYQYHDCPVYVATLLD